MSTNNVIRGELSTSTLSARSKTKKTRETRSKPDASLTPYGQAEVLSRPSSSRLADAYKTKAFLDASCNDVQFHVARNLLLLRRYRRMSQAAVARAVGTSQSAIARIETAQENITLDTLKRIIVALDGRFFISIPPSEVAAQKAQPQPWWDEYEGSSGSCWSVVAYATRRTLDSEEALVALERPIQQQVIASTSPQMPGLLLAASSTGG